MAGRGEAGGKALNPPRQFVHLRQINLLFLLLSQLASCKAALCRLTVVPEWCRLLR